MFVRQRNRENKYFFIDVIFSHARSLEEIRNLFQFHYCNIICKRFQRCNNILFLNRPTVVNIIIIIDY